MMDDEYTEPLSVVFQANSAPYVSMHDVVGTQRPAFAAADDMSIDYVVAGKDIGETVADINRAAKS